MQDQWIELGTYWLSQRALLLASYWLNQATVLFVLGCHVLSAWAAWQAIGKWGRALTIFSALLWASLFMRLTVQVRAPQAAVINAVINSGLAGELFFWSAAGFLCALAVGYVLRQTMLALTRQA